jgi:cobalt-zinc-cadmium efflux system protein
MVPIDELYARRRGDPDDAGSPLHTPGAGEDPVVTRLHGRHDYGDRQDTMGGRLRTAFLLTIVILAVEIAGGALARSLALIADAGHVLTDLFALGLAWFAQAQAARPSDASRTYGYHRTGILAALANAVTLIVILIGIVFEAARRLQHPEVVTPWIMFLGAGVGIAVNAYIGVGLRGGSGQDLNIRAVVWHVFGDIAASVAVIIGAGVIALTRWYAADPLISLIIAALIAKGAWDIVRETVDILMEGAPRNLDLAQMVRDMMRIPRVQDVHDLHVWSIAGGMPVLTAHVQVAQDCALSACEETLVELNRMLRREYRIAHTTIQFECAGCDPNHLYCDLTPGGPAAHDHVAAAEAPSRRASSPR